MAITITNEVWNHRALSYRYVGDGVTTASSVSLRKFCRPSHTCKATVMTGPAGFDRVSGKGGLVAPTGGTNVTVASSTCANGTCTVTTSAAVTNGTTAYVVVVLDQPGD